MKQTLLAECTRLGIALADAEPFCRFGEALIEKNKVMNLTAITEPEAVAKLHFADCLALLTLSISRANVSSMSVAVQASPAFR